MEAVKHKMDALVKEKLELIKVAKSHEDEIKDYEAKCSVSEKAIRQVEKEIANFEDELDKTLTEFIAAQERLDEAQKIASDAELDVNALTRKVKLLAVENDTVDERYRENIAKVSEFESSYAINEGERKRGETKSFAVEEKLELMVTQLEEANVIAEEADRKFEDVQRKSNVVKSDLERMIERSEDFESKIQEFESELQQKNTSLRKMEEKCGQNAEKEDKYDNEERDLGERLKTAETLAEFGERTVEKLENTIDNIQDGLFEEKTSYRDLSVKLDNTLRDMMKMAEEAAHDCE